MMGVQERVRRVQREGEEGKGEGERRGGKGGEGEFVGDKCSKGEGRQLREFEWRMAFGCIGTDDILLLALFIATSKIHIICFSIPKLFCHPQLSAS